MSSCANSSAIIDVQSPGVPSGVKWVSAVYTNETLYALHKCCPSSYIHRSGLNSCVIWCELLDEWLDEFKDESKGSYFRNISRCMDNELGDENYSGLTADTRSAAMPRVHSTGAKGLLLAALVVAVAACQ
ncbi:hypothetical protein VD0002_g2744 [Verticillium dahliae]|uniref:Uncharacterized protein n=2 Tax=Verticillium dahliae TaxID=27337 RepID=G2X5S3_VERDV|nr:uncharacterized protein VDAG_05578 [Verticillium dahliae VdLs.17]KAF3342863.1 hypothetical protein VdG2_08850 [Verticillium dahliae VDG2]KAH6700922.1 hypothetical protein EV126DRAFT_253001 [Verticillium dahliae]EGY14414.1 hypothetical protein VDAG_05578 [Verticillium dahliae VdLs.17]PNH34034.1 hypothetical protein BJF96_g2819 [Verticillium dahliae]PNH50057.1 hypothetical protein VD0003_g7091 [Verticillium dahliae]